MKNKDEINALQNLMMEFLQGRNRSIIFVNSIEGFVIKNFSDVDFYDDLVYALSMYNPGGGDNYLDEEALSKEFTWVLTKLQTQSDQSI